MAKLSQDKWNNRVLTQHPVFWPLLSDDVTRFMQSFDHWPQLSDYQQFLEQSESPVLTRSGCKLTVVPQDEAQQEFADQYEPRIYLKGELQTRINCWHDFFQILIWKLFPKTKACINELHYYATKNRLELNPGSTQRSVLENTLTQYDECGAIVISTDPDLLECVKQFDWHTLFWKQRQRVQRHLKCITFGHAIYEKSIQPYIGMTSHSILLLVPEQVFFAPTTELLNYTDAKLSDIFTLNTPIESPQDLSPFPFLGMPGWHEDNAQKTFYDNSRYFRPGRKQKA